MQETHAADCSRQCAGIIPELHIGSARVQNVAVLVVEDADLDFAAMNYQIDGSLGLALGKMDSGSQGVILSASFYARAKQVADTAGTVTLDLAGAGGVGSIPAIGPVTLAGKFANSCVPVNDVHILTRDTGSDDEFYGVIGQSALQRFTSVIVDFRNMQFRVRGAMGSCNATTIAAGNQ